MRVLSTICIMLFTVPVLALAQTSFSDLLGGTGNTVSMQVSPRFPQPFETVTASLDPYTQNTAGMRISWLVNGAPIPDSDDRLEVSVPTGGNGEPTQITATLSWENQADITVTETIIPTRIDLTIEAETLVPAFYMGRALPSPGSTIRAIAIPNLGDNQHPREFSYNWRVNNRHVYGVARSGEYVTEIELPDRRQVTIGVDVYDRAGTLVAQENIALQLTKPELYFYENNPLHGLSRQAIIDTYNLTGAEATIWASPYYLDRNIGQSAPYLEWKINGQTVDNPSDNPQAITLRAGSGSGEYPVSFHVRDLITVAQGARDEFTVRFGE